MIDIFSGAYNESLRSSFIFETKSYIGRTFGFGKMRNNSKSMLHLGCGTNYIEGFVNADFYAGFKFWRSRKTNIDWMLDLRYPLKCRDNVWDGVFSEHVFEHLYPGQVLYLMKELNRTMRTGGVIRIVVPDLEQIVRDYVNTGKENQENSAKLIWDLTQNWGHRSVWDFQLMKEVLTAAGFRLVTQCTFQSGQKKGLLVDSAHRSHRSLYVEALK